MRPRFAAAALHLWLLAAAALPLARAESRWPDERVADPFFIHADFSLQPYDSLITEMSRLQRDLERSLGIGPSREPVHLLLFSGKSAYEDYVQQYFPGVPTRRALFIKERGPGMVFAYRNADFEVDVRHESTHALLHASLPLVPLWLDEGLAEYFEAPPEERVYDHPHLGKVKWGARFGQTPSIERLEQLGTLSEMGQTEYRHAWAWVHFMLHGPPAAREELRGFLADIAVHSPPGMLSKRLRMRIPQLDEALADHFKHWKR